MKVIYLMLPIALALGFGFVAAFIWITLRGQYDDLETPAHRILIPEDSLEASHIQVNHEELNQV